MSPRSGTPVKLLGREDASVDWYNLEKSKRVKPFRCGEFDACIEKAEASNRIPIKKREKYARREDAILHALELEMQYFEKRQQKYGTNSNTLSHECSGSLKKMMTSCSSSRSHLKDKELMYHGEPVNSELQCQPKEVDLLFEEQNEAMPIDVQKGMHGKQMNWDDDNSALLPRMRGLQDFGLHMVPSKRKEPIFAPCGSSQPALFDNHVDNIPDLEHCIEEVNDTGGVKNSIGVKRKILNAVMDESLVRSHDGRHPHEQGLQNSVQLPKSLQGNCEQTSALGKEKKEQIGVACHANESRCIHMPANPSHCFDHTEHFPDQMQLSPMESGYSNGPYPPGLLTGEGATSGLIGDGEISSSTGDYLVDDLDEETALHQDAKSSVHGSRNSEGHASECASALGDQEKLGKKSDNYDMLLSNDKVQIVSNDQTAVTDDIRVSKWHMKGKRNIRNSARKSMEIFGGKDSVMSSDNYSGSLNGSVEKKQCVFKTGWERLPGQSLYHKDEELNYVDDDDFFEKDSSMIGFGKRSYALMLKAAPRDHIVQGINDSDEDSHKIFLSVWEVNETPHLAQTLRAYWEESDELLDAHSVLPLSVDVAPRLVDVNLKVQASYQGEHVPLVSLMSRLNGKAIVGHPVHIEILEDGFTNFLCHKAHLAIDELAAPIAWRTGKRTAMQRIPRLRLSPSAQGEESVFMSYGEGKPPFKKPSAAPSRLGHLAKSSNHRKFHKRLSKKGSLPSQKTRTLSSFATEKKCNHVNDSAKHRRNEGSILDGLIKPGSMVSLVTCVPVKLVFTRIVEAVGRPTSGSLTHQALLASSIQRTSS